MGVGQHILLQPDPAGATGSEQARGKQAEGRGGLPQDRRHDITDGNGGLRVGLVAGLRNEWNFPFLLVQPGATYSPSVRALQGPL